MEPLLFKFKTELKNTEKNYDLFYDENEELVKINNDGKNEFVINSKKSFVLGTKKAKVDGGEDQKATLFWK